MLCSPWQLRIVVFALPVLTTIGLGSGLRAQDVVVVADEVAASHLVKRVEPVYPPFPKAAGIQGTVRVRLSVSPSGGTEFVDCETGPGFFLAAAQEAAEQYVYQPFLQEGRAVEAEFLVDVVFRLPSGTQAHKYRPAPLSGSEFKEDHPAMAVASMPPALRNWVTAAIQPHLESIPSAQREARVKERIAGTMAVSIPTTAPGSHLYLVTTRTADECGNHGQCHTRLVEERDGVARLIADASANGFAVHKNAGSPYPDVFLSDYGGASHLIIRGYSNVGGEWGQLYCGDILTGNGDRDVQNDVHECR